MCRSGQHIELMDSNSTQKLTNVGKKTYNFGVGACATRECDIENDYCGALKDIVKLSM